jgi:small subunit ribosomal protein S14
MSKESIKARELKRIRLVEKYAEKRKELKEAGDYVALQVQTYRSSKGIYPPVWYLSRHVS